MYVLCSGYKRDLHEYKCMEENALWMGNLYRVIYEADFWEVFLIINGKVSIIYHLADIIIDYITVVLTLPHIDASCCLCGRRLFENIVTKEEINQNKLFLLLQQCLPLLVIGYPLNYRDFLSFDKKCSKSFVAELLYVGKG